MSLINQLSWKSEGNLSENQITVTTDMNEYQVQNEGGPKKTGKKGEQPARTHYNLRNRSKRQELEASLTDQGDV